MLKRIVATAAAGACVLVAGCSTQIAGTPVSGSGAAGSTSAKATASAPRTPLAQLLIPDSVLPGSGRITPLTAESFKQAMAAAAGASNDVRPAECAASYPPGYFDRVQVAGKGRPSFTVTLLSDATSTEQAFERAKRCPRYETQAGGRFTTTTGETVPGTSVPARASYTRGTFAGTALATTVVFATVRSITINVTTMNATPQQTATLFNAQVARVQSAA